MKKQQVIIFDTTLRDGQQCPGAGMSFEDNIHFALLASKLGINVLEAGFPSASKLDFEIVETIAKKLSQEKSSTVVAGLCQLRPEQVEKTLDALKPAMSSKKARLHTYLPVDPELLKASLGEKSNDKNALTKHVYEYIKIATKEGVEVEFSPEGYSKMEENFDWTTDVIRAAIDAGATTINCPDTIGGAHRFQGKEYFVEKIKLHKAIIDKEYPNNSIIWSCHCHNDFGTAVENSINSVFEGPVRQVECSINGVGERAGNASLEQIVMIIKSFSKKDEFFTNINAQYLKEISDFVSDKMLMRQANYPITGDNSARHSSGGHTNAILKNPLVYQPFDPKDVGNEITFVFGPLSGGNHSQSIIKKRGYICEDREKAKIAQFIKDSYKERRKGITDLELMNAYFDYRAPMKIEDFDYSRKKGEVYLKLSGIFFDNEEGIEKTLPGKDSPLTVLQFCIEEKMPGIQLKHYSSEADSESIHAKSISSIHISYKKEVYTGKGVDEDIEVSALKALINSVNFAYIENKYKI